MDDPQLSFHSFYRITSIEYTRDGGSIVGVHMTGTRVPCMFRLSQYCYRFSWLKHFHQPDFGTIWELTKQHRSLSFPKRVLAFVLIKGLMIKDMLIDWEEEAKRYIPGVGREFDDW